MNIHISLISLHYEFLYSSLFFHYVIYICMYVYFIFLFWLLVFNANGFILFTTNFLSLAVQWDKGFYNTRAYLLFLQHIKFFFLLKYFYSFSPNEHTHIYLNTSH